jgi:D-methionine transport system ATP-binding protein
MEEGRIIEQGSVLDVFGHPQHPTTQNFVKTVIQNSITPSVQKSITTGLGSRICKLNFVGASTTEPLLYEMIRTNEVKVNILFANTTEIQETTLGTVIVQLDGDGAEINKAVAFLKNNGVSVEEVEAYVLDHSNR